MEHTAKHSKVNHKEHNKCRNKCYETVVQVKEDITHSIEMVKLSKSRRRVLNNNHCLFLILYCFLTTVIASSYNPPEACSGDQQRNIFNSMPKCQSRATLIDLREKFSNHGEVIQVVPDHVSVERCGGSCYVPSHSCNPTMRTTSMVQVMLVLSKWPHGEHETVCTEVEVDVHQECECGCKVQPDQCLPDLQYFHQPSCRCICTNPDERNACILNNKVWDPDTCQCHCPVHSWQHCSTGYMFDYVSSCSCVQISSVASKSVIDAIILLFVFLAVFIIGGFVMFRFKRGLFKEETDLENVEPNSFKRNIFMSQISKSEFDLMNLTTKLGTKDLLTIYEFDEKRRSLKSRNTTQEVISNLLSHS